ncbi:uncharacterized protein MELLADRAFT_62129 [Melampsora larici-populina 98AG31]|uniref:Secreted protein n=1 Tax=Melampsora larici-populina (strain 98AG31 / pathotype 3-4-7) TaxID=747676 RepID=F4RHP4_MELLP|nr:uncharacterized protein MELLADRAFT_62129 [Melampsora larici-populina 98AG31]EGG08095.1 hypothetical protein MELLADRAFT_62129 [Melampsora larici-populina 98AG31]
MKGYNTLILTCTRIMLQWWYFATPASAVHPVEMGDSGLCAVEDNKDWYIHPGVTSTRSSSKDLLAKYLDKNLEDRKNSAPFFPCNPSTNIPPKSLKLMNRMLQSNMETWPENIQEILRIEPSVIVKEIWGFMFTISDFMTTPVLQKTLFILKIEQERTGQLEKTKCSNFISGLANRYEKKLRDHIGLLGNERKPKEVNNIFTKDEQEKLGEYGIRLEKKWSPNDEVKLYKSWGLSESSFLSLLTITKLKIYNNPIKDMSLYMSVKGTVKEILESQIIQISWLKRGTHNVWDEMHVMVKNSWSKEYQALTSDLVTSIKSLEKDIILSQALCDCQRQIYFGIYDAKSEKTLFDEVQAIIFWVKHMPFYLEMISSKDTFQSPFLITDLIKYTEEDVLDSVMKRFLNSASSWKNHENVINRFLAYVQDQSDDENLEEITKRVLGVKHKAPREPEETELVDLDKKAKTG